MTDSEARPSARSLSLRKSAGWRVADGFGRAFVSAQRCVAPSSPGELANVFASAREEGLSVTFRGAGRSYGDASLNAGGLLVDLTGWNRILAWDPQTGVLEAEPGVTIEDIWKRVIADGYWPHVVPGTMRPTLGGVLAMNVHGKNNFKAGPFGEHVLEIDVMRADGSVVTCSRESNAELFRGAIGGLGVLGAITRVKLALKKLESGRLRVTALASKNLDAMFDAFEERLPQSDYLVGWVDCIAGGSALGRGQIHQANYLSAKDDPEGAAFFDVEKQGLPTTIFGVPKAILWRFMGPFMNNLGVRLVNTAKYVMSRLTHGAQFLQSHVGFAFLLDYVPDWRLAYGPEGFLQYQVFVPHASARAVMKRVLEVSQARGLPAYLGVLKRHRPDEFLMSHALDGWSLALDFKVPPRRREKLIALLTELTAIVVEGGGRFYFAKDGVIAAPDVQRSYGTDRLARFEALREQNDPEGLFSSQLSRRALGR